MSRQPHPQADEFAANLMVQIEQEFEHYKSEIKALGLRSGDINSATKTVNSGKLGKAFFSNLTQCQRNLKALHDEELYEKNMLRLGEMARVLQSDLALELPASWSEHA